MSKLIKIADGKFIAAEVVRTIDVYDTLQNDRGRFLVRVGSFEQTINVNFASMEEVVAVTDRISDEVYKATT